MGYEGFTRRNFVKTMTIAGVSAAVFGLTSCAPQQSEGASKTPMTPGTYQASGSGKFGPVLVETEVSESAVVSVKVIDSEETEFISDAAIGDIPAAIVEHQAIDVDVVTGATLTSAAIMMAVGECIDQAGGKASDFKGDYEPPVLSEEVVDIEGDVVIVGAGASGMVAAITSARLGAEKVILLEKSCNVGGNALVSGGYLEYVNAPDEMREEMTPSYEAELADELAKASEIMPEEDYKQLMKEYEDWKTSGSTKVFDSEYLHALQYVLQGEGGYEEMHKTALNISALDEWLESENFPFKNLCSIVGYAWPRWTSPDMGRCGQGYFMFYNEQMKENNWPIEIHLNTPAEELIIEDGKVVGVMARGADGATYRARGKQGVVLATGGFSGSPDMLREYNTAWPFEEGANIPTTNCYGHTGDGIKMGLAAGGVVDLMDLQMPFPMADCQNSTDETTVGDDVDCVIVNKEGKRFMNEVLDRFTMTENIMAQTDQMMYMITDADTCRVEGDKNRYGHSLQRLIDQGQLYRADTIEGLAVAIGCDSTTLKDTIERYNEAARSGEDPEFGRTIFSDVSPIENPPFYASPRTWAMHITMGGLVVDVHDGYKVLDAEGNHVPGLRAIGETTLYSCGIGVQGEGFALGVAMFGK